MKTDELVKRFIQVRERRAQLKAAYQEEDARYIQLQNKIEAVLLARFNESGIESVRTAEGTAYTSVRTSVSVADGDAFFNFVKEHGAYEMIERRPAKTAIEQYKAANDNELPPGLNWSETRVINFRKS